MRTLGGSDAITTEFGRCTTCHLTVPGSKQLNQQGLQFAGLAKDMGVWQLMMDQQPPDARGEVRTAGRA